MSQNAIILPTSGTVSGLQLAQKVNDALDTLNTHWAGNSAPNSPEPFQFWADTTNNIMWQRNAANTAWVALWGFGARDSGFMIGSTLQQVEELDGTYASSSSLTPFDNSPPQSSEMTEFTQAAITFTPKSATSTLLIDLVAFLAVDTGSSTPVIGLFKGTAASSLATAVGASANTAGFSSPIRLSYREPSGGIAARVYHLRYGGSVGNTYINGTNSGPLFGGTMLSGMRITEIEL